MPVAYICDHKVCEDCSYPTCNATTDINHAKNFENLGGGVYIEKEREDIAHTILVYLRLTHKEYQILCRMLTRGKDVDNINICRSDLIPNDLADLWKWLFKIGDYDEYCS